MKPVAAGNYRHKITLQQEGPGTTRDSYGQKNKVWESAIVTMGNVSPISARDVEVAKSFKPTTSHKIRMRYRPDVVNTMRVLFRGTRVFSIDGIINVEELNVELNLFCTEVVGVTP